MLWKNLYLAKRDCSHDVVDEVVREYWEQFVGDEHGGGESECRRHMASLYFHDLGKAKAFVKRLVAGGLDISVQTYKAACPPGALTKLPLIAGFEAVDMVVGRMEEALRRL